MRETEIGKYIELVFRTNYFKLREAFYSFEVTFIPNIIFDQFEEKLEKSDVEQILITECEKHNGKILKLIEENKDINFILTFANKRLYDLSPFIFKAYSNVTATNPSIYEYGFINTKFDYIFAILVFEVRERVKNENFISRQHDLAALEKLLLHLNPNGDLFIILTADFTFGGGEKQNLRKFI